MMQFYAIKHRMLQMTIGETAENEQKYPLRIVFLVLISRYNSAVHKAQ